MNDAPLEKIDNFRFRVPRHGNMNVDGLIFANDKLMESIRQDQAVQQVINVATLPGIVGHSIAMPDIHWGYGFPIGGVAAFDINEGVVSPGGVGYDINCGVRVARTHLTYDFIKPHLKDLVEELFRTIPAGVGSHHKKSKLNPSDQKKILTRGATWAIENGFGNPEDLAHTEAEGALPNADPSCVSPLALERGRNQIGTVGSGNHFIEIEYIDEIYDDQAARTLQLERGQIMLSIHSGSRGLGYQVCDDYLGRMLKAAQKYGIPLADRQLCCAPLKSPEAQDYLSAMACAANYAFTNRQMMLHLARETFMHFFQIGPGDLGMDLIYDVAHNICKFEDHEIEGKKRRLCVHRKGATRAYPPHHPETPEAYKEIGQPVLIPGDMGRYSFLLVGTEQAYRETLGSSCHGAGRRLSRRAAKRQSRGRKIYDEMERDGIILRSQTLAGVLEEVPEAYKDVADVVDVVAGAGIARKVVRLRPIGVIKG